MAKTREFAKEGKCSLCGGTYTMYGNNPEPLKQWHQRCCHDCNQTKVIPARIARMYSDPQPPKDAA